MSLWGATVITNLISAIPWIGHDIVESIFNTIINLSLFLCFRLFINNLISELPTIGIIHKNALNARN